MTVSFCDWQASYAGGDLVYFIQDGRRYLGDIRDERTRDGALSYGVVIVEPREQAGAVRSVTPAQILGKRREP